MNTLHIITRCSRTTNILNIKDSIFNNTNHDFDIYWHIIFDTSILKDINAEVLSSLEHDKIELRFRKSENNDYGHNFINICLNQILSGWVYVLDDDNILHEDFLHTLSDSIENNLEKRAFIVSQDVSGKDFTNLLVRDAKPENMKVGSIDMAQFILRRDLIGFKRLKYGDYKADGYFIEDLYLYNPEDFLFIDKILCHYNYFQTEKMPISLPRILLMGEEMELKSNKILDYEEDRLNVKFIKDVDLIKEINSFNPDSIITIGENNSLFENLFNQNVDIRKRWLHFENKEDRIGDLAYNSSMLYILNKEDNTNPLISLFTPFFNTGDKLIRTYNSLKTQTYSNWEWVLVNDSTDEGKTLKIAEKLAMEDARIKIYDFRTKSGGVIGESKYRAASLSNGKYLMELDHDDILTNTAIELMINAFKAYPDSKFVYSDCAEIDENHNSLSYGDGFAFGYGKYRDEEYNGKNYKVAIAQNINPKTIRHIVGVPNHFRAWEKDFYHSIGGHNRRLTIADDYDLIVRSFLKTKFVAVRKLCYLQFFHNSSTLNNTQNSCRADIQRRVRTISSYYNIKIKERFEELGFNDWAFESNPHYPIFTESRFGDDENYVNYIFNI